MPDPRYSKAGMLCYVLLFATLAQADTAPLPAEFWDYFMEYSDQQGDVFDPLDLATTHQVNTQSESPAAPGNHAQPNDNEEPQP